MFCPILPVCPGAPGSEWRPFPKQRGCFSGGTRMGEPEPGGCRPAKKKPRRARELARGCAQDRRTEQEEIISRARNRIGGIEITQIGNRAARTRTEGVRRTSARVISFSYIAELG